jgi:hypothetical protein
MKKNNLKHNKKKTNKYNDLLGFSIYNDFFFIIKE